MLLFFDTETTGLPSYSLSHADERQARLVQIAVALTEDDGSLINIFASRVQLEDGVKIHPKALETHGITPEIALTTGLDERTVLDIFYRWASKADRLIAHNAKFDLWIMTCLAARLGTPSTYKYIWGKPTYCTMEKAADVCRIPPTPAMIQAGRMHYKSPNLQEAHLKLVGAEFAGGHDALADMLALIRVWKGLKALETQEAG